MEDKLFSSWSSSSEENRESNGEGGGGRDEEFYEEIEAPKFVDFTAPDHCRPDDDRYWFCLRVGCDQQHLEEIDSEKIYKDFVLRVMAARSPNVWLRKALDRNAARTATKCPHSAPPKSSRPRLSRIANISSISEKMVDNKKTVVRPLLKPGSTPVVKARPVAAKYLTTPRNKKCQPNQHAFRSVQNPQPINVDVSKGRMVAKALVFHSPKKAIKVKTSVELRTPISKLCEGMNKLEISSQRKRALSCVRKSAKSLRSSASRRPLTSRSKGQSRPLRSKTPTNNEVRSARSCNSKVKGKFSKQNLSTKSSGVDRVDSLKTKEGDDGKPELISPEVAEEHKIENSGQEAVPLSINCSDLTSPVTEGERNLSELKESDSLRSQATSTEENRGKDNSDEPNDRLKFTSESCSHSVDCRNENNLSEGQTAHNEFMESDDKENVTVSDENRMEDRNRNQNGRKILGSKHDKCVQVKKIAEVQNKHLKEGLVSSCPVMKFKKPKPTNPKPFRLRTDERGILKEASLEKRAKPQDPQSENSNSSSLFEKSQRKQGTDMQKRSKVVAQRIPKEQDKYKAAEYNSATCQESELSNSCPKSKALQRLEKFRRTLSSVQKQTIEPKEPVTTKKELISFLIPGQKLDVIPEASPEISEIKKAGKPSGLDVSPAIDASTGRRRVTVAVEPNFHSTHVPRSYTKKLIK